MYDILIKNGTVVDGSGRQMFQGDLGIDNGEISQIGKLTSKKGKVEINAEGNYLCPGFIDILNHSDSFWQIFLNSSLDSLVYQGITTIIGGNCGSSPAPLVNPEMIKSMQKYMDIRDISINWLTVADFLAELEKKRLSINFGTLIGHTTLRRGFTEDESRVLDKKELEAMEQMLDDGIEQGAFGLSFGLVYSHAKKTSSSEIMRLAEILKIKDAMLAAHIRNEGEKLVESVDEILEVSRNVGVNTEISHLKAVGADNWSQFNDALDRISAVREKGVNVNFDLYPYIQTGSVLYIYLPDWVVEGGRLMMLRRLKDNYLRKKVVSQMQQDGFDYSKMNIAVASKMLNKNLIKKNIGELAKSQEKIPEEIVIDLLLASEGRVITSTEVLNEENLIFGIENDFSIIGTNGAGYSISHKQTGEQVHPRSFGAFPRFLNRYVKEKKILTWEQAIKKITKMPAEKLGLSRRGELKKGNFADIVVFNPETIKDMAVIDSPYQYSLGVQSVIVNGQLVIEDGKMNNIKPGVILRKI